MPEIEEDHEDGNTMMSDQKSNSVSQTKNFSANLKNAKDVMTPLKNSYKHATPIVAIDCEMVLCEGNVLKLGRCSIVNYNGHVLFDEYVKPDEKIIDYKTQYSGITYEKLLLVEKFKVKIKKIHDILKDKIIVGHTLESDFKVLHLDESTCKVRDIKHFKQYRFNKKATKLSKLAAYFLGVKIQTSEHDSVEDSRATLALYRLFKDDIDNDMRCKKVNNEFLNGYNR